MYVCTPPQNLFVGPLANTPLHTTLLAPPTTPLHAALLEHFVCTPRAPFFIMRFSLSSLMTMYNSLVGSSVDNCSKVAKVRVRACNDVHPGGRFLSVSCLPPLLVATSLQYRVCFPFYPNVFLAGLSRNIL